jgi:ammonia channel protein AmtB
MPFVVAYGSGGVVTYLALTTCDMFERGCRYGMSAMALLVYNWKQVAVGLCLIALGWLLFNGWRYQAQTYHTEKRQWQNTWLCHGCGKSHTRS